jgi:hypothetical protein
MVYVAAPAPVSIGLTITASPVPTVPAPITAVVAVGVAVAVGTAALGVARLDAGGAVLVLLVHGHLVLNLIEEGLDCVE